MATSAINVSGKNIYAGCAVCQSASGALLADSVNLATAIASDGSPPKGVITLANAGLVSLNNWTLATGSKWLKTGQTYYVTTQGKIAPAGVGQPIGIAVSKTDLNVQISPVIVVAQPPVVMENDAVPYTDARADTLYDGGIIMT